MPWLVAVVVSLAVTVLVSLPLALWAYGASGAGPVVQLVEGAGRSPPGPVHDPATVPR